MAHLIFIAKNRDLSSFQINGPALMGRSVECDIYVPDVFVSRHHCRFEKVEGGWAIIDQRSRNGIFYNGKRVYRRVLKHGDLIEIGSFSVRFDKGDIPENLSTMTPFGEGTEIASLMDTLYTGGLRPAEYLRQTKKKPSWVRAKEEAEAAARRVKEEAEAMARAAAEKLNFADGAELDIEFQLKGAAEKLLPQYVLVSRQMLQKFNDLMDEGDLSVAGRPVPAAPGVRRPTAARKPGEASNESIVAGVAVATPGAAAVGPKGPAGPTKDLWAGVFNELEEPRTVKGKKKNKNKVKMAAKEEAAKPEKKKRKEVEPKVPIGERFRDFVEWAKTVDVSINGIMSLVAGNPKPYMIAGSVLVLVLGSFGGYAVTRPKYKAPDTTRYTPAQLAELARANSN